MTQALLFGGVASAMLVVGAAAGAWLDVPQRLTGTLLGFASGALIAAVAFELMPTGDGEQLLGPVVGVVAGALVFAVVDWIVDQRAEERSPGEEGGPVRRGSGVLLVAAAVLDGIPENLALGATLAGGSQGLTLLAAIAMSNLPEAIVGAQAMQRGGQRRGRAVLLWTVAGVLLALAVVAGNGLLTGARESTLTLLRAVAAGAVLAALADELMPVAYRHAGPATAVATVLGFVLAYLLSQLS